MSALRSFARVPRTPIFAAQRMGFQTTALRFAGKETKLRELLVESVVAAVDARNPYFTEQRVELDDGGLAKEFSLTCNVPNTDEEGRHQEVEEHKQDSLKKSKEGKGHWKDELASDSESIVKADRGEVEASEDTISKLQKETEKLAQNKK